MPNSIPEKPWVYISADFITKLLLVQGYDSILVVVNRLTKIVHFIPTMEKTSAKGDQLDCLETIYGSYIGYLKVSFQIGDPNLQQE